MTRPQLLLNQLNYQCRPKQLEAGTCSPPDSNQDEAVMQNTSGFDLGHPQKKSTTVLPMYTDGISEFLTLEATREVHVLSETERYHNTAAGTGPKESNPSTQLNRILELECQLSQA